MFELDTNGLYFIKYSENNVTGLYKTHKRITPSVFTSSGYFNYGVALQSKDNKYGFVDTLGNWVIPVNYDNASSFSDSVAIVHTDCKAGIIDLKGNVKIIENDYNYVNMFYSGCAIVIRDNLYGLIDKNGKELIPPKYKEINHFYNGYSIIEEDLVNTFGLIDSTGRVVYPTQFTKLNFVTFSITDNGEVVNFYKYSKAQPIKNKKILNNSSGLCTSKGKILTEPVYGGIYRPIKHRRIEEGNSKFVVGVKYSKKYIKYYKTPSRFDKIRLGKATGVYVLNREGNVKYATKYWVDKLWESENVLANEKREKRIVIVNPDSAVVVFNKTRLNNLTPNRNYQIFLSQGKNKIGVVDYHGKVLLPFKFKDISEDEYLVGYGKDSLSLYDSKMNLIKEFKGSGFYCKYLPDKYGNFLKYYIVDFKGKSTLLDSSFNTVLPYKYKLYSLGDNLAFSNGKKQGVMDIDGNVLIPALYDEVSIVSSMFSKEYYKVKNKKKTGIYSMAFNMLLKPEYDDVEIEGNSKTHIDHFVISKKKKFGVVDTSGKIMLDIKYDYIQCNLHSYVLKLGKKYGAVDNKFKQILPMQYDIINTPADDIVYGNYYSRHFLVGNNKKLGMYDTLGNELLSINYLSIEYRPRCKYLEVCTDTDHCGLANWNGRILIPLEYNHININNYDLQRFVVTKNGLQGVVDINNKVIVPTEYARVSKWDGDLYLISNKLDPFKYGIVNANGKIIIQPEYKSYAITYHLGTIVLTIDGKRYFYNSEGEPTNDCYIDKHIGY